MLQLADLDIKKCSLGSRIIDGSLQFKKYLREKITMFSIKGGLIKGHMKSFILVV